jgi:hypothetical protein
VTACDWPVDESCLPDLPEPEAEGYAQAKALRDSSVAMATSILWQLSGCQFGVCQYIVRPCIQLRNQRRDRGPVTSYVVSWEGDHWLNLPCGCGPICTESGPRVAHLPGPAQEVVEVKVGGVALPPSGYRLEGDVLYRVGAVWPYQDLGRPMGEAGT